MGKDLEDNQKFMAEKRDELSQILENIEVQTEILNEKQSII